MPTLRFTAKTIDELTIEDERSFRHVALYGDLKEVLRRDRYGFRVLPESSAGRWDRALLLNLTFWGASAGGDVLVEDILPADVVAHAAWHHLAARALADAPGAPLSSDALFFGEAVASAFDVYLVGRLLGHAPRSTFLATQVPAMAESAHEAGLSEGDFDALVQGIASDPDRAFEDLRQLLFDATTSLTACNGADEALAVLGRFDEHRFASLLHHYELSNWVLYARAYARDKGAITQDPRVRAIDGELRRANVPVDWLASQWIEGR
ncbi:MAG: hypothetical protein KF850_28845 [Labilithrix sp.]|nr:hypothetical protein [Labilithrix sp.]